MTTTPSRRTTDLAAVRRSGHGTAHRRCRAARAGYPGPQRSPVGAVSGHHTRRCHAGLTGERPANVCGREPQVSRGSGPRGHDPAKGSPPASPLRPDTSALGVKSDGIRSRHGDPAPPGCGIVRRALRTRTVAGPPRSCPPRCVRTRTASGCTVSFRTPPTLDSAAPSGHSPSVSISGRHACSTRRHGIRRTWCAPAPGYRCIRQERAAVCRATPPVLDSASSSGSRAGTRGQGRVALISVGGNLWQVLPRTWMSRDLDHGGGAARCPGNRHGGLLRQRSSGPLGVGAELTLTGQRAAADAGSGSARVSAAASSLCGHTARAGSAGAPLRIPHALAHPRSLLFRTRGRCPRHRGASTSSLRTAGCSAALARRWAAKGPRPLARARLNPVGSGAHPFPSRASRARRVRPPPRAMALASPGSLAPA